MLSVLEKKFKSRNLSKAKCLKFHEYKHIYFVWFSILISDHASSVKGWIQSLFLKNVAK